MILATLILAAGESRRMGKDKQLLRCGVQNFLEATVERYAPFSSVYLVLGYHEKEIRAVSNLQLAVVLVNPDYAKGMASSLAVGIEALQLEKFAGVWITFCDMPHVREETLAKLKMVIQAHPDKIILPTYQDRIGHPAYVPRSLFSALLQVQGDVGARYVIREHPELVLTCPVDDPAVVEDMDTPEMYEMIKEREEWI